VAETKSPKKEDMQMKDKLLKLSVMLQILKDENGQDLIEYALVVALIAFAATAGMSTVAADINLAFTNIGSKLTTYVS
jgi:pilus assembly protein Flp/PilA